MRPSGRGTDAVEPAPGGGGSLVELGRIVNRHGIRGEVRMLPHNPESVIAETIESVVLRAGDMTVERRRVLGRRRHKHFLLLRLEGCVTANDAEALVGRAVCITRDELPPRQPHEAYHVELIGCTVRTDTGDALGMVREVLATGSNDVCVVTGGAHEHLIPLIADVVVRLDVAAGEIVIRPLPGLLDA